MSRGCVSTRVRSGSVVAGVAAGLADYLDVDPTLVRVGTVALALMGGIGRAPLSGRLASHPHEGSEHSVAEEMLSHQFTH